MRLLTIIVFGRISRGMDVASSIRSRWGWVGLFVTALNLFPVGQLDGDGSVRAVGAWHRQVSIARSSPAGPRAVFRSATGSCSQGSSSCDRLHHASPMSKSGLPRRTHRRAQCPWARSAYPPRLLMRAGPYSIVTASLAHDRRAVGAWHVCVRMVRDTSLNGTPAGEEIEAGSRQTRQHRRREMRASRFVSGTAGFRGV